MTRQWRELIIFNVADRNLDLTLNLILNCTS